MTTPETFVAAILAHPEEDTPRLIYADWLEEQGEGERAEFIRLQCEQATLSFLEPRWQELERQTKRLLRRHEAAWTEGYADLVQHWYFERGFVAGIWLRPHLPTVPWNDLLNKFPIQAITGNLAVPLVQRLCAHPGATRLRKLNLWVTPLGNAGLQYLIHSPYLHGLRHLSLRECQLTYTGIADFVRMPCLERLETLNLGFNASWRWNQALEAEIRLGAIGDEGLLTLLASQRLHRLRFWSMRSNSITDHGAVGLLAWDWPEQLEELHLEENFLTDACKEELQVRFGARIFL
jgi:uncharacterized protein (TIGR02996 family)